MARPKAKRELATRNVRIYSSTLALLQTASLDQGKTIARLIHESVFEFYSGKFHQ